MLGVRCRRAAGNICTTLINMKPLTFSALRLLNDGEFHSGTTISRHLGVSRTSVSNALRGLDEVGLTIHKVQGRGYRIVEPVQWLDRDIILRHLGEEAHNFSLKILNTAESTSSLLLQNAATELNSGNVNIPVAAAELQTSGRGRRGRQWHSGLGDGLVFSLLWRFQQGPSFLSGLSLAVGVAIIRTLESAGIEGTALKWPNDVMFNFCKLAGTLIELQGDMFGPTVSVIGVGLNLKLPEKIQSRIDQGATDVFSITGKMPDRNKLLAALLINLVMMLREFEHRGFAPFKEEWADHHICGNKPVTLYLPDGSSQEGVVDGVADDGSLRLRTSAGVHSYSSGEIMLCRMT
jgi:BirA family transcriptional regulator, biotin operon repressor / biotin---[acetyl-CoA-carboxylase] ligase